MILANKQGIVIGIYSFDAVKEYKTIEITDYNKESQPFISMSIEVFEEAVEEFIKQKQLKNI